MSVLKKKRLKALRSLMKKFKGYDLKRRVFRAIKETRKKKGYGIISSKRKNLFLFYKKKPSFNFFVLEELKPDEK